MADIFPDSLHSLIDIITDSTVHNSTKLAKLKDTG